MSRRGARILRDSVHGRCHGERSPRPWGIHGLGQAPEPLAWGTAGRDGVELPHRRWVLLVRLTAGLTATLALRRQRVGGHSASRTASMLVLIGWSSRPWSGFRAGEANHVRGGRVIGGGVVGLPAAWHFLRLGCRPVAVVERFRIGHTRGSSHGSARMTRRSYSDVVFFGPDRAALANYAAAVVAAGADVERVAAAEARRPSFS